MRLLVTNPHEPEAYSIIRALRPHAQKIVVTMEGESFLQATLSPAARSRLVDERRYVPFPEGDWRAGTIQSENTEREEAFIRAILAICAEERIDVIMPSADPHVYVFAKNKESFEKRSILVPVPDYDAVLSQLDKYRTIQAASENGFPCPRTFLVSSENDLAHAASELGFPLVLKPRFGSGSKGVAIVKDAAELAAKYRAVMYRYGMPLAQEYIPGRNQEHFYLLLDKRGQVKLSFFVRRLRFFFRVVAANATAQESAPPHPYAPAAARFLVEMGCWGPVAVQTRVDPRDGLPKLMEVNARVGRLWERTELGINEPLMCLQIARVDEVDAVPEYPVGVMLLNPVEDLLSLGFKLVDLLVYRVRIHLLARTPLDAGNAPAGLKDLLSSYGRTYLGGRRKVFDPFFRYFFRDPLASSLWWLQVCSWAWRERKQLGQ